MTTASTSSALILPAAPQCRSPGPACQRLAGHRDGEDRPGDVRFPSISRRRRPAVGTATDRTGEDQPWTQCPEISSATGRTKPPQARHPVTLSRPLTCPGSAARRPLPGKRREQWTPAQVLAVGTGNAAMRIRSRLVGRQRDGTRVVKVRPVLRPLPRERRNRVHPPRQRVDRVARTSILVPVPRRFAVASDVWRPNRGRVEPRGPGHRIPATVEGCPAHSVSPTPTARSRSARTTAPLTTSTTGRSVSPGRTSSRKSFRCSSAG